MGFRKPNEEEPSAKNVMQNPFKYDLYIVVIKLYRSFKPYCNGPSLPVPLDASFTDEMSDLGSDADASRGPSEPAVKRERIEMSHPLQEMWVGSEQARLKATRTSISPWKRWPWGGSWVPFGMRRLFGPSALPPSAVSVCNVHREEGSSVSPPLTSVFKDGHFSPRKLTSVFFFSTHRGLTQVWFSFGFCCNCEWLCAVPFYWMFNFEWWRLCFVFVFLTFWLAVP